MNGDIKERRTVTGPDDFGSTYVYFQEGPHPAGVVKITRRHTGDVLIDYDKDGNLFGIEILGVQVKL